MDRRPASRRRKAPDFGALSLSTGDEGSPSRSSYVEVTPGSFSTGMVRGPRTCGHIEVFVSKNVLHKYRIIAQLGRGGMADVYLAAAGGPGGFSKLLVVKVLQPELARTGEFLGMFRDEARLAARLNHPNVVQTYEVGESDGHHFIAMEYLEGQPLNRVVTQFQTDDALSLGVILRIGIDALAGLHYAHELRDFDGRSLGVVHRDITPQNVFVTYEGQVKLVDFGIAKAFDSTTHTKIGTVKGKVSYMAPEQARGESVDRRCDIFSMGILLWELLAKGRLWEGLTDIAVIGRLVQGDIPSLHSVRPDLPTSLTSLIMRALDPDPRGRPSTAEEFQRGLEKEFEALTQRVTAHRLGELMRVEFSEQRVKVRKVISKQLERLIRDTPSGVTPPGGFRIGGAGDMPVLGEGSSVHDAPTTIHTTITDGVMSAQSAGTMITPPSATIDRDSKRSSRPTRGIAFVALAAVGIAGLAVGLARPWNSLQTEATPPNELSPPLPELPQRGASKSSASATRHDCSAANKPVVELTGEIADDAALTCDKEYLLRFTTYVSPGATLSIEPGTVIRGDYETKATLVVQPGARIEARGTAESPIVFTSASDRGRPGDWGGLILLGEAPINLKDSSGVSMLGRIEGVMSGGEYGGDKPNDSSGVLSYVRIEYSGIEIAPNNEINGLTLGGVGRGTVIDHVQVRHPADDCFEFFGGTVDAKYLACQHPDDDAFDWDYGYQGRLQFLLAQADPKVSGGSNGFEGDNDPSGSENGPVSSPTIYNVTLCGKNRRMENKEHYGLLLRRGSHIRLRNAIFIGFDAGMDVQDQRTKPNISASIFFRNLAHNLAYPETREAKTSERLLADDDGGFDEFAYLKNPGLRITDVDPRIGNCFDSRAPGFKPEHAIVSQAALPPQDDFFDRTAQYVGAFRDRNDDWDEGSWLIWTD